MPNKRYDVCVPHEYEEGKTAFYRVGTAFQNIKEGKESISVILGVPIVGRVKIVLFEHEASPASEGGATEVKKDDGIPF